jgi:hypothetical protein
VAPPPRSPERALALLLAALLLGLNAAWVSARLGFLHRPQRVAEQDHLRYLEMAKGAAGEPALARQSPYCWRPLVPLLARALGKAGLRLNLGFWLITNASLLAFLLALHAYLGALGFAGRLRLLGVALAGLLQGCVRWFEYQYWMTDPAGLLVLAASLLLVHARRFGALAALGAAGALVRETYVVAYPYLLAREARLHGWRAALLRTAAVAAPGLLVSWLLRRLIVPLSGPSLGDAIADNVAFRLRHLLDNQPYVLTLGTWGVLLPLALLLPGRLARMARHRPEAAALAGFVYVTTFLISNNNERPLAYAVPAVLPAALSAFERFRRRAGLGFGPAAAGVLALQLFVLARTKFTGLGISIYQPTDWAVIAVLTVAWLASVILSAALVPSRREGSGHGGPDPSGRGTRRRPSG